MHYPNAINRSVNMLYKGFKCYIKSCLRYKLTVNNLVFFVSVAGPLVSAGPSGVSGSRVCLPLSSAGCVAGAGPGIVS